MNAAHPPYQPHSPNLPTGWRESFVVLLAALALAVVMTYPLVLRLSNSGRVDNGDGQLSIWNVAWVARTLIADPVHLFDANIFYPHRGTLAYSENNIGAGVLAVPAYWATRDPYVAHNVVVLLAFTLCALGMYYLVRYLTGDRRGAAVAAISFAFCPYIFARTAHIQLMMTAGLPFSMLAFHRLADRPTAGRGAMLGLALAAQALSCGYYGIFVLLMVGFGVLVIAATRGLWTNASYWKAIGLGAVVALLIVTPLFLPYLMLQRVTGFGRSIGDAVQYSADWRAYFASSAHGHAWMLHYLGRWNEVLFPGFVTTVLGTTGLWNAARSKGRELAILYGGLGVLAGWTSFGPSAGLYTALYHAVPVFVWLRAPARFGLIVAFALSVLAGVAVAAILSRVKRATLATAMLSIGAAAELGVTFPLVDATPVLPVYRTLATLQRAPVIEMPFFYPAVGLSQHTTYMLASTSHWMPLVNGYSDYIPPDFYAHVLTLAGFPSRDAFKILEPDRVRYAVFHMYGYNTENRNDVLTRLKEFDVYLRPLFMDDQTRLYEIVGFPP